MSFAPESHILLVPPLRTRGCVNAFSHVKKRYWEEKKICSPEGKRCGSMCGKNVGGGRRERGMAGYGKIGY